MAILNILKKNYKNYLIFYRFTSIFYLMSKKQLKLKYNENTTFVQIKTLKAKYQLLLNLIIKLIQKSKIESKLIQKSIHVLSSNSST